MGNDRDSQEVQWYEQKCTFSQFQIHFHGRLYDKELRLLPAAALKTLKFVMMVY
jgi:hypothetical protein